MSPAKKPAKKPRVIKTTNGLLKDLIWQGAVSIYQQAKTNDLLEEIANQGAKNMATIDEILAEVADIEGNTANVERVLGELNTQIEALTQQVTDLQAQIAAGSPVTQEQLDEVLARLQAADTAMDSLAPNAPAPEPTPEP